MQPRKLGFGGQIEMVGLVVGPYPFIPLNFSMVVEAFRLCSLMSYFFLSVMLKVTKQRSYFFELRNCLCCLDGH